MANITAAVIGYL